MTRTIKKYANRRLYDTAASRHVTVAGIRQLVCNGEDVVVVDDRSGQDITRNILLQVIVDAEQGSRPILPTRLLRDVVCAYGDPRGPALGESLSRHASEYLERHPRPAGGFPVPPPRPPDGGSAIAQDSQQGEMRAAGASRDRD